MEAEGEPLYIQTCYDNLWKGKILGGRGVRRNRRVVMIS